MAESLGRWPDGKKKGKKRSHFHLDKILIYKEHGWQWKVKLESGTFGVFHLLFDNISRDCVMMCTPKLKKTVDNIGQGAQKFTCQYENIGDASRGEMKNKPQDALWEWHHVQNSLKSSKCCLQCIYMAICCFFKINHFKTWRVTAAFRLHTNMLWKVPLPACLLGSERTLSAPSNSIGVTWQADKPQKLESCECEAGRCRKKRECSFWA